MFSVVVKVGTNKKTEPAIDKKRQQIKKEEVEEDDLQPITDEQSTIPAAIASLLHQEDDVFDGPEIRACGCGVASRLNRAARRCVRYQPARAECCTTSKELSSVQRWGVGP